MARKVHFNLTRNRVAPFQTNSYPYLAMSTSQASANSAVNDKKKVSQSLPASSDKRVPTVSSRETSKGSPEKVVDGAQSGVKEIKHKPSGKSSPEKKITSKSNSTVADLKKGNGIPNIENQEVIPVNTVAVKAFSESPKSQRSTSTRNMGNVPGSEVDNSVKLLTDPSSVSDTSQVQSLVSPPKRAATSKQVASASPVKGTTDSSPVGSSFPCKNISEGNKLAAGSAAKLSSGDKSMTNSLVSTTVKEKSDAGLTSTQLLCEKVKCETVIPPISAIETKSAVKICPAKFITGVKPSVSPPDSAVAAKCITEVKQAICTPSSAFNDSGKATQAKGDKAETDVAGIVAISSKNYRSTSSEKESADSGFVSTKPSQPNLLSVEVVKQAGDKKTDDSLILTSKDKTSDSVEKQDSKIGEKTDKDQPKKDELNKEHVRQEVWRKMTQMDQLMYNVNCYSRVPHFKGEIEAVEKLKSLEVFSRANMIKVNLDKAHERLRLMCIEERKSLVVGCPGLREAVFLQVSPPLQPSKYANRMAASSIGIGRFGTALDFSSDNKVDLIIVTSVAVDKKGNRIGKGEGFSDLEYALLKKVNGMRENTPVITVVHDLQVFDSLSEELFRPYDVCADIIVTPSQVIEVNPKKKQPQLMWNYLSQRRVNCIPIIKNLLDVEKNSSADTKIELKDTDTDIEDMETTIQRKTYIVPNKEGRPPSTKKEGIAPSFGVPTFRGSWRRFPLNRQTPFQFATQRGVSAPPHHKGQQNLRYPRHRTGRRFPEMQFVQQWQSPPQQLMTNRRTPGGMKMQNRLWKPRLRKSGKIDFSIKVEGLTQNVRVRTLKTALYERGVRPVDISWLPDKGIAFLHFKSQAKEKVILPPTSAEAILASLQNFSMISEKGDPAVLHFCQAVPLKKVNFSIPEVQPVSVK